MQANSCARTHLFTWSVHPPPLSVTLLSYYTHIVCPVDVCAMLKEQLDHRESIPLSRHFQGCCIVLHSMCVGAFAAVQINTSVTGQQASTCTLHAVPCLFWTRKACCVCTCVWAGESDKERRHRGLRRQKRSSLQSWHASMVAPKRASSNGYEEFQEHLQKEQPCIGHCSHFLLLMT